MINEYERLARIMCTNLEIVGPLVRKRPNVLHVRRNGTDMVLKMGEKGSIGIERAVLERTTDSEGYTPMISDWFVVDNYAGVLKEFIEGRTLERNERLTQRQYSHLKGAVKYLHGKGVYFLDIHPENVLITPECVPRLFDFDLCTLDNQSFISRLAGDSPGKKGDYRNLKELREAA